MTITTATPVTVVSMSKRARIIALGKEGKSRKEIVDILSAEDIDISYQYVYNTLKEKSITVPSSSSNVNSKSKRIKELHKDGKSKAEIVKIMKEEAYDIDYHYVFMITKYHIKPEVIEKVLEIPVEVTKKKKVKTPKTELA